MTTAVAIRAGSKVSLHFSLRLENNDIVDSTFGREPASLTVGDGNLPEGFEKHIHGLEAGSRKVVTVPPEELLASTTLITSKLWDEAALHRIWSWLKVWSSLLLIRLAVSYPVLFRVLMNKLSQWISITLWPVSL